MLLLTETPAGFALFKVTNKKILKAEADDIWQHFSTPDLANQR